MAAPFLNAKQVDYKTPGSVAGHYGWNERNIGSAIRSRISGGDKNAQQVQSLLDSYLGKRNVNLRTANPQQQINALDYAYRELSRKQQTKKGFFDSVLGKIVGVGATALGGVLGGPIGGALAGGAFGGASGGLKGGLLGALGGYAGAGALGKLGLPTNVLNVGNPLQGVFSNIGSAAGGAAGGGNGVGILSNISGFMNSNPWVGDLAGAGLNYFGSRQASNQMTDAANRAFESSQFKPYNINGPLGGASFSGNSATGKLSPAMQKIANEQLGVAKGALTGYNKFNPNKYANEAYRTMSNYVEPQRTQETDEYLSNIYNRGAWGSTTGARDIYSLDRARQAEDNMFRMQAQQLGAAESDRLFNNYFKAVGQYAGTMGIPYDMITQGLGGGSAAGGVNARAASYPWLAAQNSADASAAFWSSLGGIAMQSFGNAANRNANAVQQQRTSAVTPGAFSLYTPQAQGVY